MLLLVVSAALFIVILMFRPPKPACLILVGADYGDNLAIPHNSFGWQTLVDLKALDGGGRGFLWWTSGVAHVPQEPKELRVDDDWDKGLEGVRESVVMIYLAMHGAADSQGAYFLRQDAQLEEQNRLRLDAILTRLEKYQQAHKNQKSIVLVLDPTGFSSHWPLGVVRNEFVRKLKEQRERIEKIPKLVVLCASGEDQRSWPSEEHRRTIFGHFVIEGMRGAVAPSGGRISAQELFNYVKDNVERWVRANRGALQTPLLLGGENRAREIEVSVTGKYEPPAPPVPVEFKREELERVWKGYEDLSAQVPPPSAYTPHLWRAYLNTSLRYEQLLLAGDQRRLPELKGRLDALAEDIRRGRTLGEQKSMRYSLAMPAALGQAAPWTRDELREKLNVLLRAEDGNERDQKWREMSDKVPPPRDLNQVLLQVRLTGLILERAGEDLARAHELLALVNGRNNQRPAEAHFLRMLLLPGNLDARRSPRPELMERALQVRELAENVALAVNPDPAARPEHPYSEYVYKWIQGRVEAADELRRFGQDYLFSNKPADGTKAAEYLNRARGPDDVSKRPSRSEGLSAQEGGYEAARVEGEVVRRAVQTSHDVLAALPYYSQWQARRQSPDQEQRARLEQKVKEVENLWKDVDYLVRKLESGRPEYIYKSARLLVSDVEANLETQTEDVQKGFDQVQDYFLSQCRRLADNTNYLQSVWRDLDDVLTVPFIPLELRWRLLNKLEDVSHTLNRRYEEDPTRAPEESIRVEANDQLARETANHNGRLMLAALGQDWFDSEAARGPEKFVTVADRVKMREDESWANSLIKAGDEIALRWRRLSEVVKKRLEDSRKSSKLDGVAADLQFAERLTRLLDGTSVRPGSEENPVQEARRLRLYNLLVWQARRTFLDHWWGEVEGGDRYYRVAGSRFLEDARDLLKNARTELGDNERERRFEAANQLLALINGPGELVADRKKPALLNFTDDAQPQMEYALTPQGEVPHGYPVLWMDSAEPGLVVQEPKGGARLVVDSAQKETHVFELKYESKPDARPVTMKPLKATLHGFYRGQPIRADETLKLYLQPEVIAYQNPPPNEAGLAVRADPDIHERYAPSKGAIVIVLDCSGSMGPRKGVQYRPGIPCKWTEVTKVLKDVLGQLPEDVFLSVFVFSHNVGRNIDPEDTITCFRKPSPWKQAQLDPLMHQLVNLEPWNETPLVRAMWEAKRVGFPERDAAGQPFEGFKTMLVLTDGQDNRFYYYDEEHVPPQWNIDKTLQKEHPTKEIGEFIRIKFEKIGVVVNLVGFKVANKKEAADLRKNFEGTLKELDPPGRFRTIDDIEALNKELQESLKQDLRFWIEDASGKVLPGTENGLQVSRRQGQDQWVRLDPGNYYIRVQPGRTLRQLVHLERGDYLLVNLRRDLTGKNFLFERVLDGNDYKRFGHDSKEREGWLLTLRHNYYRAGDQSLEMLLSLENSRDRLPKGERDTIRQVRPQPQAVWLEVEPQGAEAPPSLFSWGPFPGYAAPTWRLNCRDWPPRAGTSQPANPRILAWWSWQNEPASFKTIDRTAGAAITDVVGRKALVPGGAGEVVIEGIEIRDGVSIEGAPGELAQTGVTALVVRASFPNKTPIWLDPVGVDHTARQHRYYNQAGKYTGIFWPVTRDTVQTSLRGISVYSVDRFKTDSGTLNTQFDGRERSGEIRPPTVPEKRGSVK
jgi:hypothetical protein